MATASTPAKTGRAPRSAPGTAPGSAPATTTWAARADPHRRAVLELLRERPRPVGELVERLGLSQPGTSKHLRVLRDAGLVTARTDAQRRVYELSGGPLRELDAWLGP